MTELDACRERINAIDEEMQRLFLRRMAVAKDVAAYKIARGLPVRDAAREKAMIDRRSAAVADPDLKEYYAEFLKSAIALSRMYQEKLMAEEK